MKKAMLVMAISFVMITTTVFFIYPYLKYATKLNFEGVYIRYAEHEFGKEWDTLVINKQTTSAPRYQLTRRWKYERVLGGKSLQPEFKIQKAAAQFLDEEELLVEEESGIRYSYNENRKELLAGTTIYKKIK